ncbi:MAG TPA: MarR family transcriptional regulator [Thermoleophilia bacterium]|nr:MarR family transcriptional regulator [Thermoleophilia bacterium]
MTTAQPTASRNQTRERERAAVELWSELTRLTGAVRGSLEAHLDGATGLLPEEADLLVLLAEAPEQRLRMADVSAALRLSKSGVTRLVDRLVERHLVVRAPCPKDRRVIYAGLTEDGRRAAAAAAPALSAGLAELLAGRLSPAELTDLTESLRRLTPVPRTGVPAGADA